MAAARKSNTKCLVNTTLLVVVIEQQMKTYVRPPS